MASPYDKPKDGFKKLTAITITDKFAKTLQLVYPAARDIAKELDVYASAFVKSAKERMDELVATAQRLTSENERLKKEAEEARKGTAEAVMTIHKIMTSGLADLRTYKAGEENKPEDEKTKGVENGTKTN